MKKNDNRLDIRIVPMKHWQDMHITSKNIRSGDEFFEELLLRLEKENICINKIVFFGNLRKIRKLLSLVRGKFPFLMIGDSLSEKMIGKNVSLYINGTKILNGQSQQIKIDGEVVGNYFNFPDSECLNVAGIYLKNKGVYFKKESTGEYAKIAKVLKQYNFEPQNIYRFWNYMVHIWENYPAFNAARNAYFKKNSIVKFPAATGIEARLGFGKKISLGFEAIKPKENFKLKWETVNLDTQAAPQKYSRQVSQMPHGPKFSRAVEVKFPNDKIKKFYVSGISSANKLGESSLTDDMQKNVAYVMTSFEKLLKKGGFSLDNLVSSHVYSKNQEIFQEFEKLYVAQKWDFPYNSVFTNICRQDFFFEIEGIAADVHENRLP